MFFRVPVVVASGAVAVAGLVCFVIVQRSGTYSLSSTAAPGETILFLALALFLTFAHELGHATVLVHYRRHVIEAGFFIFFGSPAFFVDASDGLLLDRRQRIMQAFAGPFAELVLAGIASIIMISFPDTGVAAFLYRFALINYFVIFLNLIPLLELDGYWIFADLIQVPDLRRRSLNFVKRDLWHKLAARTRLNLQETGLAVYGIVGTAFTIFSFYTAFFLWREIFGGLVTGLWEGGLGSRILLVLLALVFVGPVIRGLFTLARTIWKRIADLVQRLRFRFQRSWRVEAAALIDALPAFDDLDEDVLSDLAGRVDIVSIADGQAVFRRGDVADAFYVVRSGTIRIEDELEEGAIRSSSRRSAGAMRSASSGSSVRRPAPRPLGQKVARPCSGSTRPRSTGSWRTTSRRHRSPRRCRRTRSFVRCRSSAGSPPPTLRWCSITGRG